MMNVADDAAKRKLLVVLTKFAVVLKSDTFGCVVLKAFHSNLVYPFFRQCYISFIKIGGDQKSCDRNKYCDSMEKHINEKYKQLQIVSFGGFLKINAMYVVC